MLPAIGAYLRALLTLLPSFTGYPTAPAPLSEWVLEGTPGRLMKRLYQATLIQDGKRRRHSLYCAISLSPSQCRGMACLSILIRRRHIVPSTAVNILTRLPTHADTLFSNAGLPRQTCATCIIPPARRKHKLVGTAVAKI